MAFNLLRIKWHLGEYKADKFHGTGQLKTGTCEYNGKFANGYKHGLGTCTFKTGDRYEGSWERGRFHGRGLYIWADGRRYDGAWHNGQREGQGTLTLPNGERYEGAWARNEKHGVGWSRLGNGKVREAEWRSGDFVRWKGPEQFETQLKLQKTLAAKEQKDKAKEREKKK
jgi:hypothetical protein